MRRIYFTLATAAASALAAAAIVALPAVGDEPGGKPPGIVSDPDLAGLVACLRAHGLDAPSAVEAFKPWLARQEASDPRATRAAERACMPQVAKPTIPDEFISCVRGHGLDAPTAPAEFERWAESMKATDALDKIFRECKLALDPGPKPDDAGKPGDCEAGARKKPAEPRQSTGTSEARATDSSVQ
jgi:hypothetical protein